jgi:hypothetical protein
VVFTECSVSSTNKNWPPVLKVTLNIITPTLKCINRVSKFFLRFVLSVSLDCPFLIAPSVFSYVYLDWKCRVRLLFRCNVNFSIHVRHRCSNIQANQILAFKTKGSTLFSSCILTTQNEEKQSKNTIQDVWDTTIPKQTQIT